MISTSANTIIAKCAKNYTIHLVKLSDRLAVLLKAGALYSVLLCFTCAVTVHSATCVQHSDPLHSGRTRCVVMVCSWLPYSYGAPKRFLKSCLACLLFEILVDQIFVTLHLRCVERLLRKCLLLIQLKKPSSF